MKTWIKLVVVVALIALGLYIGLWLCLVGGIVSVVEAVKSTPVDSMGIALGILRVLCTSIGIAIPVAIGAGIAKS